MSGKDPIPREQSYEGVRATNPPQIIPAKRNPLPSDRRYPLGSLWINIILKTSFQLVDNQGTWNAIGAPVGGAVQTLTTSDAVVVAPAAGNINISEGLNILTTGAGDTVTIATDTNPTFTTVTTTGDITSGGNILAPNGSLSVFGNVATSDGDVIVTDGNIILTNVASLISSSGSASIDNNLTVVNGLTTLTNGDLLLSSGSATFDANGASITFSNDNANIVFESEDSSITFEDDSASITFDGVDSDLIFAGVASGVIMHGTNVLDFLGETTLVAGTSTIANDALKADDRIFLQRRTAAGVIGDLTYDIDPGVDFTITSDSATDTSVVSYFIVRTP